jgi:hypothetical protein
VSACIGSYKQAIRVHPNLGAGECPGCGRRFDRRDLAGEHKQNVPLHSPLWRSWDAGLADTNFPSQRRFDR